MKKEFGPVGTIYDTISMKPIEPVWIQPASLLEGTAFTNANVTENWLMPIYDPESDSFYNAATVDEQSDYEATQQASIVQEADMSTLNEALITPQTSVSLNNLYPAARINFRLTAKNVGTGMVYIKVAENKWMGTPLFALDDE
jgi:hypothetical protein